MHKFNIFSAIVSVWWVLLRSTILLKLKAELEVDGGILPKTTRRVVGAGARVLVAGAAIFKKDKSVSETMAELRASYGD